MNLHRALEQATKIAGWYTEDELEGLWSACRDVVQDCGILEVGCFAGRSSSLLAQFLQTVPRPPSLTFIDPFLAGCMCGYDMSRVKAQFLRTLAAIGTPYRLIEKCTAEVTPTELPQCIDLLHIDGNHSTAGLSVDCQVLLPRLRAGGIVCFHDYGVAGFDVTAVVDSLPREWKLVGTYGTLRALRKDEDHALDRLLPAAVLADHSE